MKANLISVVLAALVAAPAFAQSDAQCILAGRVSEGHWAPRFAGVQLLAANGQVLTAANRQALAGVRQARLAQPALLSACNGDQPLASADHEPAFTKADVPALSAGIVDVEAVAFPKLRTGGELVELRVKAAPERVVMLMR